jgi:hypothetical protein
MGGRVGRVQTCPKTKHRSLPKIYKIIHTTDCIVGPNDIHSFIHSFIHLINLLSDNFTCALLETPKIENSQIAP